MFSKLPRTAKAFFKKEDGLVSVEFALYVPMLLFAFAATVTYFDAFRQENSNLKAAYTVSDLISRETNYVNETYIDSMLKLTALMIRSDSEISVRISVVRWDEEDARHYVDWSKVRGSSYTEWTDETVEALQDSLPTMPDQERVIVVETNNELTPLFEVGLPTMNIQNLVFTRPRFAPQVVFVDTAPNDKSHNDNAMKVVTN